MKYLQTLGSRIQTLLNGIKRPIAVASKELSIDKKQLEQCIQGQLPFAEVKDIIQIIVNKYPIRMCDIYLERFSTEDGIIYCSSKQSLESARITKRMNHLNQLTEYYRYFDCAMSKHIPFKPERIEILRETTNTDPNHGDVAYNRGHLETQLTYYIGDVNFYYTINGINYCKQTNTGDSSVKVPYIPHTFTKRNSNSSFILAIS